VRVATLAPDPWDWDELLFVNAVAKGFDLRANQPHPPGYPLLVESAMLVARAGATPFAAMRAVGAAGALLAVTGVFVLLRTLGQSCETALLGAAVYAFVPSVWLYGTRPISDGPAAAAFLFACAAAFREEKTPTRGGAWVLGLLAAAAFGVRPQVALWLAPPIALALFRRLRDAALALAVFAVASAAIWAPVVRGSGGWSGFAMRWAQHGADVARVDSQPWRALATPWLWGKWFVEPFGERGLAAVVLVGALVGLAVGGAASRRLLLAFAPLVVFSLKLTNANAATRYGLALFPAVAALFAIGVSRGPVPRAGRAVFATAVVGALAFTALPAVVEAATRASPPVDVITRLLALPGSQEHGIVYSPSLKVHAAVLLAGHAAREFRELQPTPIAAGEIVLSEFPLFGARPALSSAFHGALLRRLSALRVVQVLAYTDRAPVGVVVPKCRPPAAWERPDVLRLPEGSSCSLYGPVGAIGIEATVAPDGGTRTRVVADTAEWTANAPSAIAVAGAAAPNDERLVTFTAREGAARLSGFTLRGGASAPATIARFDDAIPASVDAPADSAVVAGPLRVAGWCQERGGGAVAPVEVRVDGVLVRPMSTARVPRPDVASAIPGIGDARAAGYELTLDLSPFPPGRHRLTVTFQTADGRRRVHPDRVFVKR
jgi:hypothetical protein